IGDLLVHRARSLHSGKAKRVKPLRKWSKLVLQSRQELLRRLADVLLKWHHCLTGKFGEPSRRPSEDLIRRLVIPQADANRLKRVVGLESVDRLLAGHGDFAARHLELHLTGDK